jgi:hypothetical protein
MPAAVIREPGELRTGVLSELLARKGPALIDARIDASTRLRGAGRVEALQHMSMLAQSSEAV